MNDLWVPIILFLSIAAAAIGYLYFNSKNKQARQATLQAAIQRGDELTPELISAISADRSAPVTDYRRGVLLIALGIGFALLGRFVDPGESGFLGIAAIPVMLGLGYLFVWRFGPKD